MYARNCKEPHSGTVWRHWIRQPPVIRLIMCGKELPKPRSRKAAARRSLMRHIVDGGLEVPYSPELAHVLGGTERDANVLIKGRDRRWKCDVIFAEMFDDLDGGPAGIDHHEICVRIDPAHHPRVRLIEELLPIVRVSFHA